jgi:protein-S-isoprenylcysteine O-methyltransferase Ste14
MSEVLKRIIGPDKHWVVPQLILVTIALVAMPLEQRVVTSTRTRSGTSVSLPGIVSLLVGVGVAGEAKTALSESFTMSPTPVSSGRLMTHGIYGTVRHPMYLSVLLVLAGWGLIWRARSTVIVVAGATIFLSLKVRREEELLRQQYPTYDTYREDVRWRFIPGCL